MEVPCYKPGTTAWHCNATRQNGKNSEDLEAWRVPRQTPAGLPHRRAQRCRRTVFCRLSASFERRWQLRCQAAQGVLPARRALRLHIDHACERCGTVRTARQAVSQDDGRATSDGASVWVAVAAQGVCGACKSTTEWLYICIDALDNASSFR